MARKVSTFAHVCRFVAFRTNYTNVDNVDDNYDKAVEISASWRESRLKLKLWRPTLRRSHLTQINPFPQMMTSNVLLYGVEVGHRLER